MLKKIISIIALMTIFMGTVVAVFSYESRLGTPLFLSTERANEELIGVWREIYRIREDGELIPNRDFPERIYLSHYDNGEALFQFLEDGEVITDRLRMRLIEDGRELLKDYESDHGAAYQTNVLFFPNNTHAEILLTRPNQEFLKDGSSIYVIGYVYEKFDTVVSPNDFHVFGRSIVDGLSHEEAIQRLIGIWWEYARRPETPVLGNSTISSSLYYNNARRDFNSDRTGEELAFFDGAAYRNSFTWSVLRTGDGRHWLEIIYDEGRQYSILRQIIFFGDDRMVLSAPAPYYTLYDGMVQTRTVGELFERKDSLR